MSRTRTIRTVLAGVAIALAGCVVSDEVTTLTIHPDGSADLVLVHTDLRSSERGAKAEQELADHAAAFDAGRDSDQTRIRDAGGEIVAAQWIQRAAPAANFIAARLPAAALEKYLSISGKENELRIETHFTQEGDRRRLSFLLLAPKELDLPPPSTLKDAQQKRADGFSETRIAVTDGTILGARGFTIAGDRRSALFSIDDVAALLRDHPARVELTLEWSVAAK